MMVFFKKKIGVSLAVFVTMLSLSSACWAGRSDAQLRQVLAVRTNSEDLANDVSYISAVTDSHGVLLGLQLNTPDRQEFYSVEDLRRRSIPLVSHTGAIDLDVISVSAPQLDPIRGGHIVMTVLREFFLMGSDDYRQYNIYLAGDDSTPGMSWNMFRNPGARRPEVRDYQHIDNIFFGVNVRRGHEVGIERITVRSATQVIEDLSTGRLRQVGG